MISKREDLSHNAIVNWRIWRRNCLVCCVKTSKSNQFCKTSQENRADQIEEPTPPRMRGLTWLLWDPEKGRGPFSLM